jgi:hypothetical protein
LTPQRHKGTEKTDELKGGTPSGSFILEQFAARHAFLRVAHGVEMLGAAGAHWLNGRAKLVLPKGQIC